MQLRSHGQPGFVNSLREAREICREARAHPEILLIDRRLSTRRALLRRMTQDSTVTVTVIVEVW